MNNNTKIIATSDWKRGYGSCTICTYINEDNKFDYIEVVEKNNSKYQRDAYSVGDEPLGMTIEEISQKFRILNGRFFSRVVFDEVGNVVSTYS